MPTAPLRICLEPHCGALVRSGRCEKHQKPSNPRFGWTQNAHRLRGRGLQRARERLFREEPFCRTCRAQGRKVLATVRDHILALAEGGAEDEANVQPLCRPCSDAKTQAEAARGRR